MTSMQATAVRFTAVPLGMLSTLALLMLMASLIQTDFEYVDPVDSVTIDKIVMPETKIVNRYKDVPVRPVNPPTPPEAPPMDNRVEITETGPGDLVITVPTITDTGRNNITNMGVGDYLPQMKVAPQYPRRAAQLGIEGEVVVSFTVTKTGSTRDIVVVKAIQRDGTPTTIFNSAAIKAAAQFKYKPRITDGAAQDVYGVENRFVFEMME